MAPRASTLGTLQARHLSRASEGYSPGRFLVNRPVTRRVPLVTSLVARPLNSRPSAAQHAGYYPILTPLSRARFQIDASLLGYRQRFAVRGLSSCVADHFGEGQRDTWRVVVPPGVL
jgi:hypothetical protein